MRRSTGVAAMALCLAALPATASADQISGSGAGSVGAVDIAVGQQTAHQDPLAPCEVDKTAENRSDPVTVGTTTKFGLGSTTCKRNDDGTVSVQVSGQRFETTVLKQFGGPVITARTFKSGCNSTANGSNGSMELGTVTGVTVPQNIPANYVVTIPGANGAPPLAEVVLNELIVPTPADGSLVTHAMHIKLFPQGGPASGDILVGTAVCAPYGG
ncbi:hypothetical protein FPZ12_012810 [Amycolatopsis acidicola]|uniref:DUF4232 domain-containing protein n=1 Tax=Amycolatopsis acidicola TaxID=2596893 RepID=A0A5N0VAV2_9PSEU|nr:choice-of-anchor P family protein [Amycolatopsis acidicola]KAA9162111.1 hypothetical protein FPZ12_012810 [Amycolatopsis acidicola]